MATSKKTGLRTVDLPQVDAVKFADAAQTKAWEQVRTILNTRFGKAAGEVDRSPTWGELVEQGVVSMRGKNGQVIAVAPGNGGTFEPKEPEENDGLPPAPTGVKVTPGLSTVIIEWDRPHFSYFGYAEIFRATVNNLSNAVSIGQTSGWVYSDPVGSTGLTYYYWVRFVSKGGRTGAFNGKTGHVGQVSYDPAYLIDILSAEDPKALLFKIPDETVINGVTVAPGVYIRDLYVANGSISHAKIGNAAIDNAKISSLSAEKVTFGEMSGDRISVNTLKADRLVTETLAAKLAQITEAYVGTANIGNATVTNAKIKDLSAEKITSGYINTERLEAGKIGSTKFTDWLESDAKGKDGNPFIRMNFRTGDVSFKGNAIVGGNAKFSGELQGATGTFSGRLTADAINAVSTINIADGAVAVVEFSQDATTVVGDTGLLLRNQMTLTNIRSTDTIILMVSISCSVDWKAPQASSGKPTASLIITRNNMLVKKASLGAPVVSGIASNYGTYPVFSVICPGASTSYPDRPGNGSFTYNIGIEHSRGTNCTCYESSILALIQKK